MNTLLILAALLALSKKRTGTAPAPAPRPVVKPGPIRIDADGVVVDELTGQVVGTVVKGNQQDVPQTGIVKIQQL